MTTVKYLTALDQNTDTFGGHLFSIALIIHLLGWIAQFVGHGKYERRAPAIATNIVFAIMAPFFVLFEILSMLFAYKKAVKEDLDRHVCADIAHDRLKRGLPLPEGIKLKEQE